MVAFEKYMPFGLRHSRIKIHFDGNYRGIPTILFHYRTHNKFIHALNWRSIIF